MRFSIGESIGAAFGLIRTRPAAVFVWGSLIIGPVLMFMPFMLSFMSSMTIAMEADAANAADPANGAFPTSALAGMMAMQGAFMLLNLLQILAMIVVYPAVMRAVIRPEERSWFSMRVGMDELRVAVVAVVVFGGLYGVLMFGTVLVLVIGGIAGASGASPEGVGLTLGILLLAIFVGILCAFIPFSLMTPATLHYRRFAFVEGWRLARTQWVRLLGLHITTLFVIIAIEIGLMLLIVLGAVIVTRVDVDWSWVQSETSASTFPNFSGILATWWPLIMGMGLMICAVYGMLLTMSVAPTASACAQLARQRDINSLSD